MEQGQPGVNFGSSTQFVVDASPVRRSLLRFTVTGVAGRSVTRATLRLYCVNGSSTGGALHGVPGSSWGERTVTWSNAPAGDTAVLGNVGAVAAGSWYSIDVTSLVTGDGTFSLDLTSTNSDGAYYSSKEGPAGQAPQLVVSTAGSPDLTAPDAPSGLVVTGASASRVDLAWSAAHDDVGVTGYRILRGGVEVGRTTTQTTFADTTVVPSTSYSYTVTALDAAGHESLPSAAVSVTTPAASGDVTAPDAPSGLVVTGASASRVDLSWVAAHDDVGVTAYRVLRGGVEVGRTTTQTTFADTTVQPSTGYSYTVTALDAAGHESLPSAAVSVTTSAASAGSVTVVPAADAYVSAAAPTANYGTQTQLRADGSPWWCAATCASRSRGSAVP